jgi:hypothetical protein
MKYYMGPWTWDRFLGMTEAMENGYQIWKLECEESVYVRFVEKSSKKISEM